MQGLVLLALFGIASFWLAIHARAPEARITLPPTPQAAAVALMPERVPLSLEGTIVLDDAPAKNVQAYVLFAESGEDGKSVVKTKRLVLPTRYVCMQGDVPCATPTGEPYPFKGGERVAVTGVAEADLIYVESLRFL